MSFGSFQSVCETVPLPLCALVGPYGSTAPTIGSGIEARCYSRTIEAANTIIFQAASGFVHIGALIMCLIMVFHVRSKFTAVGTLSAPPHGPSESARTAPLTLQQAARKSPPSSTSSCC